MHLIDVTNNYSDLVHSQLNTTDANYVKVYSLGNTSVIYTESKDSIGIALEKTMTVVFAKMRLNS